MNVYNKTTLIENTKQFVRAKLNQDCTGHDWWHVERVYKTAIFIAKNEGADQFVVSLAALLHDIADWKFCDGDENAGPKAARLWLEMQHIDQNIIDVVANIILNLSFKGAKVGSTVETLEGCVVQDADRLDAIGAIGIARAFAFGGAFAQPMHDPELQVVYHDSFESYKKKKTTSINHFHEKLLLLKDRMNTETGKRLAAERHEFIERYLNQFYQEWEANFEKGTNQYHKINKL